MARRIFDRAVCDVLGKGKDRRFMDCHPNRATTAHAFKLGFKPAVLSITTQDYCTRLLAPVHSVCTLRFLSSSCKPFLM
jgi:hypothetical protein